MDLSDFLNSMAKERDVTPQPDNTSQVIIDLAQQIAFYADDIPTCMQKVVLTFGKCKGMNLYQIYTRNNQYLRWLYRQMKRCEPKARQVLWTVLNFKTEDELKEEEEPPIKDTHPPQPGQEGKCEAPPNKKKRSAAMDIDGEGDERKPKPKSKRARKKVKAVAHK